MLDQDDLDYLGRRRSRRGARAFGPIRVGFLAVLLVLHLGALLLVRDRSLRARPPEPRHDEVLVVRLLPPEQQDEPPAAVALQERVDAAAAASAPPGAIVPGESGADASTPAPADSAYLFNTDGSLKLPEGVLEPEPTAFRNLEPAALPAPRTTVPYKPTRFDAVWVQDHETLGERLVRKATVVKTFDSNGTRITCAWSLFAPIMAGCGWGLTPREPTRPAPWLAVAGQIRPETPPPFDPDPFD